MASAGRRQIFGGGTSITKSRRWRPQINGGGSAGARLYLKDCYPIRFFCFLLLFSSSRSYSPPLLHLFPSPPLLHLFPSPPLLLLLVFFFSSLLSPSSPPPPPPLILILLLFPPPPLFLFLIPHSSHSFSPFPLRFLPVSSFPSLSFILLPNALLLLILFLPLPS